MIPQHSSVTNEHYTPEDVAERARRVLGAIDLDPASCEEANATVGAEAWMGQDIDGLAQPWAGRVFLNPPGGILIPDKTRPGRWIPWRKGVGMKAKGRQSSMVVWWDKLVREWAAERVTSAIFVGFTLEILRGSQAPWCAAPVQAFPRCYPSSRMKFRGSSPTHANVIVGLPPHAYQSPTFFERFRAEFSSLGLCEPGAP